MYVCEDTIGRFGEATVIIRGIGNYTGECHKSFIVQ